MRVKKGDNGYSYEVGVEFNGVSMHKTFSERLTALVVDSFFTREEVPDPSNIPGDAVVVEGVARNYAFHPARIEKNKPQIIQLIREVVPDVFLKGKGGGFTFLNLCNDRNGEQWTDLHREMEALVCLGIAVGRAGYCLPRDLWAVFPGGVPYVYFDIPAEVSDAEPERTS